MATSSIFETPTFKTKEAARSLAEAIQQSEKPTSTVLSGKPSVTQLTSAKEIHAFFQNL